MVWIGGLAVDDPDAGRVLEALDACFAALGFTVSPEEGMEVKGSERALVIRGTKGWTSVYLELTERDAELALALSERLATTVVAHRSILYDGFALLSFHGGEQVDDYRSCPELFQDVDDPVLDEDGRARTTGDASLLASFVSRIDAAGLGRIYEGARVRDFESGELGELPIPTALKELRRVTGIGTFEHAFEDLWYGADELRLDVTWRAYLAPRDPEAGRIGALRKRWRLARERWGAAASPWKARVAAMRDALPKRAPAPPPEDEPPAAPGEEE